MLPTVKNVTGVKRNASFLSLYRSSVCGFEITHIITIADFDFMSGTILG